MRTNTLNVKPEKIIFGKKELIFREKEGQCKQIPYSTIVLAYLEIYDEKKRTTIIPELQDITKDMRGNLVIWDDEKRIFYLKVLEYEVGAGILFIKLANRIPFAFLGYTPWIEGEDEQEFMEMKRMIALYKEIHNTEYFMEEIPFTDEPHSLD